MEYKASLSRGTRGAKCFSVSTRESSLHALQVSSSAFLCARIFGVILRLPNDHETKLCP